jgi:sarcosine oxidase, subunit alpha
MRGRPHRVPNWGQIDRTRNITFAINGKSYAGHPGDTLASALLANGVRTVARSLKFHRPRGIYSCGIEEPNGLVQLGKGRPLTVPAARAPTTELAAGLSAYSLAGWPSVNWDLGRVLDAMAHLWAAGFYNKTFIWPSWRVYEPFMRHMAGFGRAPPGPDPDRYDTVNLHCDVLVVGGGLSGLTAALAAGLSGARVILAEQDREFGGRAAWGRTQDTAGAAAWSQIRQLVETLKSLANVRTLPRTTATGFYGHNVVTLLERVQLERRPVAHGGSPRERYLVVRADRIVLATGSIEQPLIFDHNDRPGIMLAGAVRQYLTRYGVAVGSSVLIATNNDSAYALATDLVQAGVRVVGLADTRAEVLPSRRAVLEELGIPLLAGTMPVEARGFSALRKVRLGRLSDDSRSIAATREIPCDALAVSGGFNPALQLYAQAGGRLEYDARSGGLRPVVTLAGVEIVGSAADAPAIGPRLSPVGNPARQWIDLLHDVTVADLKLALRENFTAIEHVKRYTTVGMGLDQGKTSTVTAIEVLGRLRGVAPRELGHATLRPPVTPVTLGAIAGREKGAFFAPHRRLPMHEWHVAHGALMEDFGEWHRPAAYPREGESHEQAVRREARQVRTAVGLFDGSSLGKIEVGGPDAQDFLDRFYINDLKTLRPYRTRYGLMLRENGIVFDDGTVVMRSPDRFLVTTTSGSAGQVVQWLEEWHQCEWPELRVAILPVAECWATLSLTGPLARAVLSRVPNDLDLASEAFPHLSVREGTVLGGPARVYRVSFSGELTYEINVPTELAPSVWQALLDAGDENGIQPFGLEALMLLRLEKGFLHVGTDTDGTTVPDDVGFGKVASAKRADFIGKRSLRLPEHVKPDRLQLVGLAGHPSRPFIIGSHLRVKDSREATDGWITSAGLGVFAGNPIALAMVRGGRARMGEFVTLYDAGARIGKARIVSPVFYDPSGERMNA